MVGLVWGGGGVQPGRSPDVPYVHATGGEPHRLGRAPVAPRGECPVVEKHNYRIDHECSFKRSRTLENNESRIRSTDGEQALINEGVHILRWYRSKV